MPTATGHFWAREAERQIDDLAQDRRQGARWELVAAIGEALLESAGNPQHVGTLALSLLSVAGAGQRDEAGDEINHRERGSHVGLLLAGKTAQKAPEVAPRPRCYCGDEAIALVHESGTTQPACALHARDAREARLVVRELEGTTR